MKTESLVLIIFCLFLSCGPVSTSKQKRKVLINQAIQAIEKYDTSLLYSLLDTERTFNFYGKEDVLSKIKYAHDRLKICGTIVKDGAITIQEIPGNFKRYIVPYCRGKSGEIIYDSFDFLFTFADFLPDEKISRIDITIYRKNIEPIMPPSSPSGH